ncbi:MAG TPA: twin-arginine translocase TatA/TatE family subunit [Bacteroidia bacterium]|jgi:sec-independent protein translocase protein TatA|nr:twin-arginine translocase TatA/TatE family subunit [Bacteroidia bacterium]
MNTVLLLFDFLGGGELFIVFLAVLLLFGGKGMPTVMRNIGKGIRQFKDATSGIQRDIQESANNIKKEIEKQVNVVEEKAKEIDKL